MWLFVSGQVEGQQLVKLAAVNSRPKSGQERKQSPPVLTIVELEHKLRKKVNNLGKFLAECVPLNSIITMYIWSGLQLIFASRWVDMVAAFSLIAASNIIF